MLIASLCPFLILVFGPSLGPGPHPSLGPRPSLGSNSVPRPKLVPVLGPSPGPVKFMVPALVLDQYWSFVISLGNGPAIFLIPAFFPVLVKFLVPSHSGSSNSICNGSSFSSNSNFSTI